MTFQPNGNVIVPNGNMGIGTTSPDEKLHVIGAIKTSRDDGASENTFIYNQATAKWGSSTYPGIIESVGNNSFLIGSSQNIPLHLTRSGAIALTIGSSLNVGIGTTSPSSNLHVHGAGGSGVVTQIKVTQADDGGGHAGATAILQSSGWGEAFMKLGGHQISAAGGDMNITSDSDLKIQTGGTNTRMFITNTGNVGISTTSPNEKLHVVGNIKSSGYLIIGGDDAARIALGSGTGDPAPVVIETFSAAENIGAFLDFTIYDDGKGNMRSGTLQLVFNADQVMFNEVNTMDIGDTTPCTLDAVNNAGTIDVRFTTPDPTFHIKYHVRTL